MICSSSQVLRFTSGSYLLPQLGGGLRRGIPGLEQLHQAVDLRPLGGRHPEYPSVHAFQSSAQRGLGIARAPVPGGSREGHAALLGRRGRPHGARSPAPARVREGAMRDGASSPSSPARRRRRCAVMAVRRRDEDGGCHGGSRRGWVGRPAGCLEGAVKAAAGRPQLHALLLVLAAAPARSRPCVRGRVEALLR